MFIEPPEIAEVQKECVGEFIGSGYICKDHNWEINNPKKKEDKTGYYPFDFAMFIN